MHIATTVWPRNVLCSAGVLLCHDQTFNMSPEKQPAHVGLRDSTQN